MAVNMCLPRELFFFVEVWVIEIVYFRFLILYSIGCSDFVVFFGNYAERKKLKIFVEMKK